TRPSTAAGSTWPRSNCRCSLGNASTGASPTGRRSAAKRGPGKPTATRGRPRCNGVSPPPTLASASSTSTQHFHLDGLLGGVTAARLGPRTVPAPAQTPASPQETLQRGEPAAIPVPLY